MAEGLGELRLHTSGEPGNLEHLGAEGARATRPNNEEEDMTRNRSEAAVDIAPTILEGRRVRLEPLDLGGHFEGLLEIGLDPDLWLWTLSTVRSRDDLRLYLDEALREQAEGRSIPFATRDLVSGKLVGSTRFGNIDRKNR